MPNGRIKYTVKRAAPGKGLGLFATEQIKRGEFIVEYTGKRLSTEDADKHASLYLFKVDDTVTID